MDRNLYYVGIAFFGMINGIFNQLALLFALIHVQILAPALLFGSVPLTLMFSSLMVPPARSFSAAFPPRCMSVSWAPRTTRPKPPCGSGWPAPES